MAKKIEKKSKKLLYFSGEECVQCKHFGPKIIEKCEEEGIEFEHIPCQDESKADIVAKYGVRGVPYAILLVDGEIIMRDHAAEILKQL